MRKQLRKVIADGIAFLGLIQIYSIHTGINWVKHMPASRNAPVLICVQGSLSFVVICTLVQTLIRERKHTSSAKRFSKTISRKLEKQHLCEFSTRTRPMLFRTLLLKVRDIPPKLVEYIKHEMQKILFGTYSVYLTLHTV